MFYYNKKDLINDYKGHTLSELCNFYNVDNSTLTEDDRQKIIEEGYDVFADDAFTEIPEWLFYELHDGITPSDVYFDDEVFTFITDSLIKSSSYGYLVINTSCDWLHHTGYKTANTIKEIFARDYDVTQEIIDVTSGGKMLKFRESSHDVPVGASVYVIALNKKERELVDRKNFSFAYKRIKECNM